MIELSDQLRYAIYLPSIQANYARFVTKNAAQVRPLPGNLTPSDLNFFQPDNKLFHFPAALYSAGQFSWNQLQGPPPCMVTTRDREKTFVIGDSGGFQIINGKLKIKCDQDRQVIFDWLNEYTDYSMTLDVPTRSINNVQSDYNTFQKCLDHTLKHLAFFHERYPERKALFLNVLQGECEEQIKEWDGLVMDHEFDGWAIAGAERRNIYLMMKRLLKMIGNDKINDRMHWLHFLAVGDMATACVLTAIRQNLAELLGDDGFRISMDTSSPFLTAGRYAVAYDTPTISKKGFSFPTVKLETEDARHIGSSEPFPCADASPIGKWLTMGDLIVDRPRNGTGLDEAGLMMLTNHNIYVQMQGIIDANRACQGAPLQARHDAPKTLLDARDAIGHILRAPSPFDELEKNKPLLTKI